MNKHMATVPMPSADSRQKPYARSWECVGGLLHLPVGLKEKDKGDAEGKREKKRETGKDTKREGGRKREKESNNETENENVMRQQRDGKSLGGLS